MDQSQAQSFPENVTALAKDDLSNYYGNTQFTLLELIALTSSFSFLMIFGIFANLLTIYVLRSTKNFCSVFNCFILSLASSDLLSALMIPLYVYKNTFGLFAWKIPTIFCKIWASVVTAASIVTSLHILVFSYLRLYSLKWPHKFAAFTKRDAKRVIAVLWFISFACGFIPFMVWNDVIDYSDKAIKRPSCSFANEKAIEQYGVYAKIIYPLFYYSPCVLIAFASCATSFLILQRRNERAKKYKNKELNQSEKIRRDKEYQAILQMLLIVLSYMLGYLPEIGFLLYVTFANNLGNNLKYNLTISALVNTAARFSECLNPIFYNIASSKVRAETMKCLLKMLPCCFKKQRQEPVVPEARLDANL